MAIILPNPCYLGLFFLYLMAVLKRSKKYFSNQKGITTMRKTSLLILAGVAAMSVASVASADTTGKINSKNSTSKTTITMTCTPQLHQEKAMGPGTADAGQPWGVIALGTVGGQTVTCKYKDQNNNLIGQAEITEAGKVLEKNFKIIVSNIATNYSFALSGDTSGLPGQITNGQTIYLKPKDTDVDTITISSSKQ
jgi:hypothetical protein